VSHSPAPARAQVAHHFDSAEQQFDAAVLGTWIFLVTEIMFFSGMFMAYSLYRAKYPEVFIEGSHHLDIRLGTINTAVLIASSYTMVLAVYNAQLGRIRRLLGFLAATMGLGTVFLVIKGFEYHHKYVDGLVPGPLFTYAGPNADHLELFFSVYFAMTGLHALHMIIGIGLLAWIATSAMRGRYNTAYFTPVECTGLYWHFVDLVWIFLFPLLYLLGRH